jgi:hypothetical protein
MPQINFTVDSSLVERLDEEVGRRGPWAIHCTKLESGIVTFES